MLRLENPKSIAGEKGGLLRKSLGKWIRISTNEECF